MRILKRTEIEKLFQGKVLDHNIYRSNGTPWGEQESLRVKEMELREGQDSFAVVQSSETGKE